MRDSTQSLHDLQVQLAAYNNAYRPKVDWHSYLMKLQSPNLAGDVLQTDTLGFRVTRGGALAYRVDQIDADQGPKGIILGNSTSFGTNVSCDGAVIGSRLADLTGMPWYNFSGRAYSLSQELVSFVLRPVMEARFVVSISGMNELTLFLLGGNTCEDDSFFGAQEFLERMRAPSRTICGKRFLVIPKLAKSDRIPTELDFMTMIKNTCRRLKALQQFADGSGARFLFVLQPILGLVPKKLTAEESALALASDTSQDTRSLVVLNPGTLRPWYIRFEPAIRTFCAQNRIAYWNANESPELQQAEWLFWDRVHLTDSGHAILAQAVYNRLLQVVDPV